MSDAFKSIRKCWCTIIKWTHVPTLQFKRQTITNSILSTYVFLTACAFPYLPEVTILLNSVLYFPCLFLVILSHLYLTIKSCAPFKILNIIKMARHATKVSATGFFHTLQFWDWSLLLHGAIDQSFPLKLFCCAKMAQINLHFFLTMHT